MSRSEQELQVQQKRVLEIETQRQQQMQQSMTAEEMLQPQGMLEQHKVLTPISSERIKKELKDGPPPELSKAEKRQWRAQMQLLLRDAQIREGFFAASNRMMGHTEERLMSLNREGQMTVAALSDVLTENDTAAGLDLEQLAKDPQTLQGKTEILELKSILTELRGMRPEELPQNRAQELVRRYQALGAAGAAGQANATSARHLQEAAQLSDTKSCYVLLYHCAAAMLMYELNRLPAEQLNTPAFAKLYALASSSGVVASQTALSAEFQGQIAELHRQEQERQARVEQQHREQLERIESRREYLRTGITADGVPAEWILGPYAEEVEAELGDLITRPDTAIEEIIRRVGELEGRFLGNRESLRLYVQGLPELLSAQKERALDRIEKKHIRSMLSHDMSQTYLEALTQDVLKEMEGELERTRQRKAYIEGRPGLKELPDLLNLPGIETMLLMESGEEEFQIWADIMSEQVSYNLEQAEAMVAEQISPFWQDEVMESILKRHGLLFLQGTPAEVRDMVAYNLREDMLEEFVPEVLEKESSLRGAMDAAGIDPLWRKAVFRQLAPEDEPGEQLAQKLQALKITIEENVAVSNTLFKELRFSPAQWKKVLDWRSEFAGLEAAQFTAGLNMLLSAEEFATPGTLSLREYQAGGSKGRKVKAAAAGSYQALLEGKELCGWEGFMGHFQGYEDHIMQALSDSLKNKAIDLSFMEEVENLQDLESLPYNEFQDLVNLLRLNLSYTLPEWLDLQGLNAEQIRLNLLPEMLQGKLNGDDAFFLRAQEEGVRLGNVELAKEMRFLTAMGGSAQEVRRLQYRHLDDTTSTAWDKGSRATRRLNRFDNARDVWNELEKHGLTQEVIQKSIELGTGSGSGAKLHREITRLLREHRDDKKTKEVYDRIRKDRDSYINELRLGNMEEFLLAKGQTYRDFTQEESGVYKNTLRSLGAWVMPRMQELNHALDENAASEEEKTEFRLKMRPLLAGLKEGAEEENFTRFGVRSWEEALTKMKEYLTDRHEKRTDEAALTTQAAEAHALLRHRQGQLAAYRGGILKPILPLLLRDEATWATILTDSDRAFSEHIDALMERLGTPMELLDLRFSFGEDFKRQMAEALGDEMLHGSQKSREEWLSRFNEYFDAFCRHSAGTMSIDARYEELKQNDPEMANYFTEILLSHPEGVQLLADGEKLKTVLKECKTRIRPNTEVMEQYLRENRKHLSAGDEVGLRMYLQSSILFMEPDVFQDHFLRLIGEFDERSRQMQEQLVQAQTVMSERAQILQDIEAHKRAGFEADRKDVQEIQKLRSDVRASGSPLLAALGVKTAPRKEQVQEARYKLYEYRELPDMVKEILFERILSGADDETLSREAGWLQNTLRQIRSTRFSVTEEQREWLRQSPATSSFMAAFMERSEQGLSPEVTAELLMFLYINHRDETLDEENMVRAFHSLGERHLLMSEMLNENTALLLSQQERALKNRRSDPLQGRAGELLQMENADLMRERRSLTEAMAAGIYTLPEQDFAGLVQRQADYMKATVEADRIFDELLSGYDFIEDEQEKRLIKLGLREYFHADIVKGRAQLDKEALRDETRRMLANPEYRKYLKNSDSLLSRVNNTGDGLRDEERTMHTLANREGLEAFLAEKRNNKFRRAYNKLNAEERQVFALSVLETDRMGGDSRMISMRYIHSDEIETARRAGIVGQLHQYVSHEDFQPVIPYDQVLTILKKANGQMDEEAFETAMERTQMYIRQYQEAVPRDLSRLSDAAASIQAASRLSRKKEPARGRVAPEPVTTLQELRERIMALDTGNRRAEEVKARLAGLSDYGLRMAAAALEDRTLLDQTTKVKTNPDAAEFVNPEKRAALKERLLKNPGGTGADRLKTRNLTRAMTSLMSYQLRDDVDLTGRDLSKKDFAEKALARKTLVDWALLKSALDFAEEVQEEEKANARMLEELEAEAARQAEERRQAEEARRQAEEEARLQAEKEAAENQQRTMEEEARQQFAQEEAKRTAEEKAQERAEQEEWLTLLRETRLDYVFSLPGMQELSREKLAANGNIKAVLEKQYEKEFEFWEKVDGWQQNLNQNLEQARALITGDSHLAFLNWNEVKAVLLEQLGAALLMRTYGAGGLELQIRSRVAPDARRDDLVIISEKLRTSRMVQNAPTEREQSRQKVADVMALLQATKSSASAEEQWMLQHCTDSVEQGLETLLYDRHNRSKTVEELAEIMKKDFAPLVSANRAFLEEKLNELPYEVQWRPLILEMAIWQLGEEMLLEHEEGDETLLEGLNKGAQAVNAYIQIGEDHPEAVAQKLRAGEKAPTAEQLQVRTVMEVVQAQKGSASADEQWMLENCTRGMEQYAANLREQFPDVTAEELAAKVLEAAPNVAVNRAFLEERVNQFDCDPKLFPLILETALWELGEKMLLPQEEVSQITLLSELNTGFSAVDRQLQAGENRLSALTEKLRASRNVPQTDEDRESQERKQRRRDRQSREVLALLQTQKGDVGAEAQWMLENCAEGVAQYIPVLQEQFPYLTAEELATKVWEAAPQVTANRQLLEERLERLNYDAKWFPLILELAVPEIGKEMLMPHDEASQGALMVGLNKGFQAVDGYVHAAENRLDSLQKDPVLSRIPDLANIPEIAELMAVGYQEYKDGVQEIRRRVEQNLKNLEEALDDAGAGVEEQDQLTETVLREMGRLLTWRKYGLNAMKRVVQGYRGQ